MRTAIEVRGVDIGDHIFGGSQQIFIGGDEPLCTKELRVIKHRIEENGYFPRFGNIVRAFNAYNMSEIEAGMLIMKLQPHGDTLRKYILRVTSVKLLSDGTNQIYFATEFPHWNHAKGVMSEDYILYSLCEEHPVLFLLFDGDIPTPPK